MLLSLADAKSPVTGASWPALSDKYKKDKQAQGAGDEPNMELTGDMLDSLDAIATDDGVEIGFFDDQAWKADGHLKFSGSENNLPQRKFLPEEGDSFKKEIEAGVKSIIQDAIVSSGHVDKAEFKDVETKSELYDVLKEQFGDYLSTREIRSAVLRDQRLTLILDELGIIDLL